LWVIFFSDPQSEIRNPKSPIPNPKSPIPNPKAFVFCVKMKKNAVSTANFVVSRRKHANPRNFAADRPMRARQFRFNPSSCAI
jgi:hypothetical protein